MVADIVQVYRWEQRGGGRSDATEPYDLAVLTLHSRHAAIDAGTYLFEMLSNFCWPQHALRLRNSAENGR